ncbi:hypothetical protein I4U23_026510 [Adineta vaga]|nr:hypothetical protein I4U23_026510 [Adineta vaga]
MNQIEEMLATVTGSVTPYQQILFAPMIQIVYQVPVFPTRPEIHFGGTIAHTLPIDLTINQQTLNPLPVEIDATNIIENDPPPDDNFKVGMVVQEDNFATQTNTTAIDQGAIIPPLNN